MRIAAAMIAAIVLIAAFATCGSGSKSNNDSAQRETRHVIDNKVAEKSNINLTGTWVSKFSNGNSEVFIFETAMKYEHYFMVDGEEMDHGTGTYTVDGNTVTLEELGNLYVKTIEGDKLVDYDGDNKTVYKKTKMKNS